MSKVKVLLTGATEGIGKGTALALAKNDNVSLLLHARNENKCQALRQEIEKKTGRQIDACYAADLSSLQSIRDMGQKLRQDHTSLNVLINNAGVGAIPERQLSADGYELILAVNYLAPLLLTYESLPLLEKANEHARIVNVSSMAQAPIDLNDLMLQNHYEGYHAYSRSKLALIMFTMSLKEELENNPNRQHIHTYSLHPGTLLNTKMVRNYFGGPMAEVDEGVDMETYMALSSKVANESGLYYERKKPVSPQRQAQDRDTRSKLHQMAKKLVGL